MAKRKRAISTISRHPRQTWTWTVQKILSMLAFLDFGVAEGLSKSDINKGAAEYLTEKYDGYRSPEQVEKELYVLWINHGPDESPVEDFGRVYKEGTKVLRYVRDEEQAAQVRLEADELKAKQLQRMQRMLHTPRTLRSGSTPGRKGSEAPRLTAFLKGASPALAQAAQSTWDSTPSRRRGARIRSSFSREQTSSLNCSGVNDAHSSSLAALKSIETGVKVEAYSNRSDLSKSANQIKSTSSTVSKTGAFTSAKSSVAETEFGSRTSAAPKTSGEALRLSSSPRPDINQWLEQSKTMSDVESEDEVREVPAAACTITSPREDQSIVFWRKQAIDAQRERDETNKINSALRSKCNAFENGQPGVRERMDLLQSEVEDLQATIYALRASTSLNNVEHRGPAIINAKEIDDQMIKLRGALDDFAQLEGEYYNLTNSSTDKIVKQLCSNGVDAEHTRKDSYVSTHEELDDSAYRSQEENLKRIIGAAITWWVLMSDVREFFWNNNSYPTKDHPYEILCQVVSLKSPALCRAVDFETHRRLMREPSFKEDLVRKRASKLAKALLERLACIKMTRLHNQQRGIAGNSCWRLENMFLIALNVRLALVLSTNVVYCRTYRDGDTFTQDSMFARKGGSTIRGRAENDKHSVDVMLLPAIVVDDIEPRLRVRYEDAGSHNEGPSTCLSRAYVVLKKLV